MPAAGSPGFQPTIDGARLSVPPGESFVLRGSGVHTRNGDSITLRFRAPESDSGSLQFGFDADTHEHARVECNFERSVISLSTSDWTIPQPVASAPMFLAAGESVVVVIEKSEAGGNLVKNADIGVHLDGQQVLAADDLEALEALRAEVEDLPATVTQEQQTRGFLERVINDTEPQVPLEVPHHHVEVVRAIYKSSEENQPVALPLDKDDPWYSFKGRFAAGRKPSS